MKDKTRNIYPGGNTPKGFYSYYNYILPQRKAEKIFCIKGGPGVGKSTFMKSLAKHFIEKGECVDLLWCSSDPESLDGVLLKDRAVALVDGTSPHVIDPKNPGAVDEIINLGSFWNESGIRENRQKIIDCNEKTGEAFACAYGYLRCAGTQYDFMEQVIDQLISVKTIRELKKQLLDATDIMEIAGCSGTRKKFFASAVTPAGLKNELPSIVKGADKIIMIEAPVGFRTERLLLPLSERWLDAGNDVEEYYCPMDPDKKLEHIFCPSVKCAVITCNDYHSIGEEEDERLTARIDIRAKMADSRSYLTLLEDLQQESRDNITKALVYLKNARQCHDELEQYYIPNMNFSEINRVKKEIIEEIENLGQ